MRKDYLLTFTVAVFILAGCSGPLPTATPPPTPTPPPSPAPSPQARVVEYPNLDWSVNSQRLSQTGCTGKLGESCQELVALGCDEINGPRFYLGGLQPPYPVMECIHEGDEPPDRAYFKQPAGLDTRYRSYVVFQDGEYRLLIKRSEFKAIFAPVESAEEALSYAMAMTSLSARFDLDPGDQVDYLVEVIEETHVETTPEGYLVYLFDWDHEMGCDDHPFYAVKVLVTPEGDVHELERQEIYRSYACFDYGALTLDED